MNLLILRAVSSQNENLFVIGRQISPHVKVHLALPSSKGFELANKG